jgi:long-chain acyl-CoA synthetase
MSDTSSFETAYTSRPWTPFYDKGVAADLGACPYKHIGQMVTDIAQTYADKKAFSVVLPNGMEGSLTYTDIDKASDAFAIYLREVIGLQPGDRVAVQMPNSLPFPIAAFGIFKAGCVLVNVNPLYTAEEMGKQFADATPKALVIIDLFANKLPEAFTHYPVPHVIITRIAEFMPFLQRTLVGLVQRYKDKTVSPISLPHDTFANALAKGQDLLEKGAIQLKAYTSHLTLNDLACLQYTGGTTGVSKGAMLSHGNLLMNMLQAMAMIGEKGQKGHETILTALPLYHIFAFTVNFLGFWWMGGHNVLIPSPRPISNLRKALEKHPVTFITGVNTLFNALLNEDWFAQNPPKTLKASVAGGMALHGAVAERWGKVTQTPVIEGYGLTEASPVVTFNPFDRPKRDYIGIPLSSTEAMCVNDQGQPVAVGEAGELAVRGPQVMMGYWQRPDETAQIMHRDWLLTGDIATMDAEGYFKIVDRKKDMVVVSGFKVFPNEVEDCLAKHPDVVESAVIGVPDDITGEAVKAFVVSRNPALTEADIKAHCKQHITSYKIPKTIVFKDELPKTPVGKILRRMLRDV